MEYTFSEQYMNQLLAMLSEIPAKFSMNIIMKIQTDCQNQARKKEEKEKKKEVGKKVIS